MLWAQRAGGKPDDWGNSVATDGQGYSYLTGTFTSNQIVFGTHTLVLTGGCCDIFLTKLDNVTGIAEENNFFNAFTVFPNPGYGEIRIINPGVIDEILIRNILGQIIYSANPDKRNVFLKMENSGMYFLTVKSGNKITTKKLVVQR